MKSFKKSLLIMSLTLGLVNMPAQAASSANNKAKALEVALFAVVTAWAYNECDKNDKDKPAKPILAFGTVVLAGIAIYLAVKKS